MILDKINTPQDLKNIQINDLNKLADEMRDLIIKKVNTTGGHMAPNLGILETTIALHYVFNSPVDKIIYDVSHQCYPHKILSDRKQTFHTVRTDGGVSGFPDRSESVYDAFTAGHAGTSISAALGYCAARDRIGEDYYVVAVVGDGSLSNGLNLEALSAKTYKPKKLIVILNDNGMSISKNDNGFYRFLSKHTARKGYVKGKRRIKKIFGNSFIRLFLMSLK